MCRLADQLVSAPRMRSCRYDQEELMEALLSNISELLPHFPQKPHVLVLDHPPVQWKESHPEVKHRSIFYSAFIALWVLKFALMV